MTDRRAEIRSYCQLDTESVLQEFGEQVHPVVLGEPDGYIAKAKETLRDALCPHTCQFLSNERLTDVIDVALAVGDRLIDAFSPTKIPTALIWKTATVCAKAGLPMLFQCAGCPLHAKLEEIG